MSKTVGVLDKFAEEYDRLCKSISIKKLWKDQKNIHQVWDIYKDEEGNFSVDVIVNNEGGSTIGGLYRWRDMTGITADHEVNEEDKVYLYAGKATPGSTTIGGRNASHRKSILGQTSEATGSQVKAYMEKKKLSTLRICIQFIDLTEYKQEHLISILEEKTIETFETPFNKENRNK
tara:strand:+ start:600 stop:1127 length:528 start_codon:yes stop_codon:yes gene_type:complete